jgi:CheY-like chemotaxis protein
MDIQMPIVDGYEAITAIRGWERKNNLPRTPILALTASALEEAVHRSKAVGCDAHVTKPVKRSTLLEAIHDAIKKTPLATEPAAVSNLKEETCRTE